MRNVWKNTTVLTYHNLQRKLSYKYKMCYLHDCYVPQQYVSEDFRTAHDIQWNPVLLLGYGMFPTS